MSDSDFGSKYASSGNRAAPYTLAFMFLLFVPGTALLLLGRERGVVLPNRLIEFIFPCTILSLEKLAIVQFGLGGITFEDFDRVDLFTQQFFVLSFFFFFFVLIIFTAYAASSANYGLIGKPSLLKFLSLIALFFLLREFQIYALIANLASAKIPNPSTFLALNFMRAIAPEALIFVNCLMAVFIWIPACIVFRFVYDRSQ